MQNYQIYPYFLRDGVVLHDTWGGTVQNKQNFAPTEKLWLGVGGPTSVKALLGVFNKDKAPSWLLEPSPSILITTKFLRHL